MTRKDYKIIATGILMTAGVKYEDLLTVAQYIGDELERDNPKFNRDLFLQACGLKGDK